MVLLLPGFRPLSPLPRLPGGFLGLARGEAVKGVGVAFWVAGGVFCGVGGVFWGGGVT